MSAPRFVSTRSFSLFSAALALALLVPVAGCGGRASSGPDGGAADLLFATAPHSDWPTFAMGGKTATVLTAPRVVTIVASNDDLATQLTAFSDAMMSAKGTWWTSFSKEYGLGDPAPTATIMGPALMGEQTENQLNNYVNNAIAAATPPIVPDGKTVFLLYLPLAAYFDYQGNANDTCQQVPGGYHLPFPNDGTSMGDVMVPVMRCVPVHGQSQIDQLTTIASAQVADAVTDPGNGNGWLLQTPLKMPVQTGTPWSDVQTWKGLQLGEIGDVCSPSTRFTDGTNVFQRVFSNKAAAAKGDPCVPALSAPYFNTTTELDWYGGDPGAGLSIDLTGWSTSEIAAWPIRAAIGPILPGDTNMPTVRVTSPTNTTIDGITYQTIANGTGAKLLVTLPATASVGWWAILYVRSFHLDPTGVAPAGEDFAHLHAVGVFISGN